MSFSFSNPQSLGSAQTTKTFDDGVLTDGNNYAYRIYKRSLTDTLYFYHADHLGTPLAMTNTSGNFVWQVEQYPFGGIYALPISTVSNNLRFPGQYFDGETGLAQNWNRDFSKNTGRYYQSDPLIHVLIMEGLFNRIVWTTALLQGYAFADNNPTGQYDFTGLLTKLCHRRLKPLPFRLGKVHHDFLWVDGHTFSFNGNAGGHVAIDDPFDHNHEGDCSEVKCIDEDRLAKNIKNSSEHPYSYSLGGFNCQDWAAAMLSLSHKKNCCEEKKP